MIGRSTKKLVIVCDEKTEKYANYIRQLISTNDDKEGTIVGVADGSVDVTVWLDKEYLANKGTISSNEHILFIGDNKVSNSESSSMIVKYEKYGMKYGWLGKRAMMKVDNELLSPESYDEFIEYCLGYQADFDKIVMKRPKPQKIQNKTTDSIEVQNDETTESTLEEKKKFDFKKVKDIARAGAVGVVSAVGGIPNAVVDLSTTGLEKGVDMLQMHKKVKDQQYRALSVILYIDALQEFLEG